MTLDTVAPDSKPLSWWCGLDRETLNTEAHKRAPAMSAKDITLYRFNPNRKSRTATIAEEIDGA